MFRQLVEYYRRLSSQMSTRIDFFRTFALFSTNEPLERKMFDKIY